MRSDQGPIEARYPIDEEEFESSLQVLENRVLQEVLLQIIEPEINLVLLELDGGRVAVFGKYGSAVLQLQDWDKPIRIEDQPNAWYESLEAAKPFIGRTIVQARPIGKACNGHGLELSFSGITDKTLVIQSIETGEVPDGFADCLRVGVCSYEYRRDSDQHA